MAGYDASIGPTVALSRMIFEPPTFNYKTGIAFLAWLNGLQPHFAMLGGLAAPAARRSTWSGYSSWPPPRARCCDPGLAVERMTQLPGRAARGAVTGLSRLSLNQATVQPAGPHAGPDLCVAARDPGHRPVAATGSPKLGLTRAAAAVRAAGLHVSSLCRGGFFTHADPDARARRAWPTTGPPSQEAAALEADTLMPGLRRPGAGQPGPRPGPPDDRRRHRRAGPARPAARRPARHRGPAPDVLRRPVRRLAAWPTPSTWPLLFPADAVGVVVDTYHVWWDARPAPTSPARPRAGSSATSSATGSLPLPADMLLGRGHVGDGSIDFRPITQQVWPPALTATPRLRSSTRRSGTRPPTRPPPR